MMMLGVIPVEELSTEPSGILDAAEPLWKLRSVFHRLELALRERIVVGRIRSGMRPGDPEITQKHHQTLGFHRRATVSMDRKRAWINLLLLDRLRDELPGELGALPVRHHPSDHIPAKHVENHAEIEIRPLGRAFEFGYIPPPKLVRLRCKKLRLGVLDMTRLVSPFTHLLICFKYAIHRAIEHR